MKSLTGAVAMFIAGLTTIPAIAQTNPLTSAPTNSYASGPYEMGYRFTANSAISVVQLGAFDQNSNGLGEAHVVSIWSYNGPTSQTLLGSTTINAGTGGTLNGGFRFSSITPINLTIGNSYVVAASNYGGIDQWGYRPEASLTTGAITFNEGRYVDSAVSTFPSTNAGSVTYYAGSFLYSATSAAPEPGSWALMILGFGIVGYATRRRRVTFGQTAFAAA